MRNTAFIVCEYNPFHNGHALHIQKTRAAGAERVICLMSGNFVQRGEIAFFDKSTRAQCAINNGADLVLELPLKYVVSGAQYFAKGAAEIIAALGIKGTLSFGASADVAALERLAAFTSDMVTLQKAQDLSLQRGIPFAYAVQNTVRDIDAGSACNLNDPNNVLAIEYIKALRAQKSDTELFAVERTLSHDAEHPLGNVASAKYLRDGMLDAGAPDAYMKYLPENTRELIAALWGKGSLPANRTKFSAAAMARLIALSAEDFLQINGVNQGLENRILQCMRNESDLYTLFDSVKTKRFTHARIRQILISAVLGVKKEALERKNPYVRVLGMNQTGRTIFRELNETADVPLIMNLSEAPQCEERELDVFSGKLYDICRPVPLHKNPEYFVKPYVAE